MLARYRFVCSAGVIECWDVMIGIGGHLDARVRTAVLHKARSEVDEATAEAVGDAVMLRVALVRVRAGEAALDESQWAVTSDGLRELGENAAWWLRVARVWEHPLTLRLTAMSLPAAGTA